MNNFNEKEIQDYLIMTAEVAAKELNIAAYGNEKIRFVNLQEIEFKFEMLENKNVVGKYINNDGFKIIINKSLVENVNNLDSLDDELIDIIKHEMIRHHVNLKFDLNKGEYGFCKYSSPIFLSYLKFFNIGVCHESYIYYCKHSDLCKWVKDCMSFHEFEDKMIELSIEYRKVFKLLKHDYLLNTKFSNTFSFGNRKTLGLQKSVMEMVENSCKLEENYVLIKNHFDVGPLASPSTLHNLYLRKRHGSSLGYTKVKHSFDTFIPSEWESNLNKVNKIRTKISNFKQNKRTNDRELFRILFTGYFEEINEFELVRNNRLVRSFLVYGVDEKRNVNTYKVTLTTGEVFYLELDLDLKEY